LSKHTKIEKFADLVGVTVSRFPFQGRKSAFVLRDGYTFKASDVKTLSSAFGELADILKIEAFLRMHCGFATEAEFHWLTWPRIIAAIDLYLSEQSKTEPNPTPPGPASSGGDVKTKETAEKPNNRVAWDADDPKYITNSEAIKLAHKTTWNSETGIDDLEKMDLDRLKKLLRSNRGKDIHFMSQASPPRGKVNKAGFQKYLEMKVCEQKRFEKAVDDRINGLQ